MYGAQLCTLVGEIATSDEDGNASFVGNVSLLPEGILTSHGRIVLRRSAVLT